MIIFRALADIPVESVKAVKATRIASNPTNVKDAAELSGTSKIADGRSSTVDRCPSSSNALSKAQTVPSPQMSDPPFLGNLARQNSAPMKYGNGEEGEQSEDELEAELAAAEIPNPPVQDAYLAQTSSTSDTGDDIRDPQKSVSENDSSSIRTSKTRTSLKYAGSAIMGTGVGISKSVSRMTVAGFKAPLDAVSTLAYSAHNAPKLWGDNIRPLDRITGTKSGLIAAGKVCIRR